MFPKHITSPILLLVGMDWGFGDKSFLNLEGNWIDRSGM